MKILITGTAGFIGFHLAKKLLKPSITAGRQGNYIIGLDNINNYYDVNLKFARLAEAGIEQNEIAYNKFVQSKTFENYKFIKLHLEDRENIFRLFKDNKIEIVCHLAAQAGVRYSITNPFSYIDSNIVGFINILEAGRLYTANGGVKHLIYASSSSVYGLNEKMPFSTSDNVDHPISLYAASKKSNELMAHAYSYLYNIHTTGLRFFTVFGPWGRPDMALFKFTKSILEGKPIDVYNYGNMQRDFTYIDDIVEGIIKVINNSPKGNVGSKGEKSSMNFKSEIISPAPYKIYNIGSNNPVNLLEFIEILEKTLNKKAIINFLPLQPGDVPATYADVSDLINDFGYKPNTPIKVGIEKFVEWYKWYYKIK